MIRFFSVNDPYRLIPLCIMMLLFGGVIHFMLPDIALTEINGIIVVFDDKGDIANLLLDDFRHDCFPIV